jgi:Uma2 family endonuclease
MSQPTTRPPTPHRFTRAEYYRMGDAGLFANERVELLDGTIVTMAPNSPPHAGTVSRLDRALRTAVGDAAQVRCQPPVVLDDWSEPEPDVIVCRFEAYDYTREHPRPDQILLVAEVSVSSLSYDRGRKAEAYARAGILEYWMVDVDGRRIEVRRDPDAATGRYRGVAIAREGEHLPTPGTGSVAVDDVLPPR